MKEERARDPALTIEPFTEGGEGSEKRVVGAAIEREPEHKTDEIGEALKRGYSAKQIIRALTSKISQTEIRRGKIWYSSPQKGTFEVPYTYENYVMLCRILFE